jgi:hypothetical protein
MVSDEKVLELVYSACDTLNRDLPDEDKIVKSKETILHGDGASVDSLTIINLMLEVEAQVEKESGKRVSLMNADAFNRGDFATIESFSRYVSKQANQA